MNASRLHRSLRQASLTLLAILATCIAPAAVAATQDIPLKYQNLDRGYRLFIPDAPATQPRPLIVALHGGYGTGKNMEELTSLNLAGGNLGFVIAYPEGVGRSWNAGTCCNPALQKGIDDVGFLKAMVANIAKRTPINTTRVYGTGFSNGAMMTHRVACDAPDLFRAIATASGGLMMPTCAGKKPISALLIQGRADKRIPWEGGNVDGSYRPPVLEIFNKLAARNQCAAQESSMPDGVAKCVARRSCAGGTEVWLCGIDEMGHQWAGAKEITPLLLGKGTTGYVASLRIVQFFQSH